MLWFLLFAVAVAIFLIVRRKQKTSYIPTRQAHEVPAPDEIVLRVSSAQVGAAPVTTRVQTAPDNVLQPYSPIPLTVVDATPDAVRGLRAILDDDRVYGRERQERVLQWLLTTNARVAEIDAFVNDWGPRFKTAVKAICEADPDWTSAGELDREDILDGARQKAVAGFNVRVADLDYGVISDPPTLAATADDALLSRFGFETLAFYFRNADDLDRVRIVPSDDWHRQRFEALVTNGLARRGADIPPKAILQKLTLKDMEAVAEGVEHKRFTRKAPAIEFLSALPDLQDRLARHVSLRELFQPLPLPAEYSNIDLPALGHAWAYADEYAKLLETTYATAARARDAVVNAVMDEYAKGWSVESSYGDRPCCPSCAKEAGERRGARKAPEIPHHVGCICHLSQIYG